MKPATLFAVIATLIASPLPAQQGALFLLFPFGARAVGQGEAVAADTALGSEALWWNAAGAARTTRREIAVHHSQTFFATSDMITMLLPSKVIGNVTGSLYLVDYGDQPVTGPEGSGLPIGTATNRNYMAALSYATGIGSRVNVGLSYKFVMLRFTCSGDCPLRTLSGSTNALDAGVQYHVPAAIPLVIGASLRNLGPPLPVKDREQADPLPRILQFGARAQLPIESLRQQDLTLDVMADYKMAEALNGAAGGVGMVLSFRDEFMLRAGYVKQPGEGSGPTIGVGASRGSLMLDISRHFGDLSSQLGEAPTYISLRVTF